MVPRADHAGKLQPQGSGSLFSFAHPETDSPPTAAARNLRNAVRHFDRWLGRPATIADLTSEQIFGLVDALAALGLRSHTVEQVRQKLCQLGAAAHAANLLAELPRVPAVALPARKECLPWSAGELEALFGSARTMPGIVDGVPARRWWPALLLTLLDTGLLPSALLAVPKIDYDRRTGTLCTGLLAYQLHPLAVEAVDAIRFHDHARLFPWPWDNGRPPFHMLHRRYKELLFRANLPHVATNMFQRLQVTARKSPEILGQVNLYLPFTPRAGKPYLPRARDRRRWEAPAAVEEGPRRSTPLPKGSALPVVRLHCDGMRSLKRFFEDSYRPLRLADANPASAENHLTVIERFSWFLACDATVANLTDDTVERFLAWLKRSGMANPTINRYRACLLAQWKHAWRKRLVDDQPRDVAKFRVAKRVPEAWSAEEVAKILQQAEQVEGMIGGVPAGAWWRGLLLTLYDTGLRIAAAMQLRSTDLNAERWLSVPAEVQKQDADQTFRLHPETMTALLATHPHEREWLFPWPYDSDNHYGVLTKHYKRILKAAGLPLGRRDLFHKLRRTSATAVCDALDELAAKRHLGHSSLDVTRRYLDPRKIRRSHSAAEVMQRPAIAPLSAEEVP